MTMLRTARWKFIDYDGLPPQLFDMHADPQELHDLGRDPACAAVREELRGRLFGWLRQRKRFPTISPQAIAAWNRKELAAGIDIGVW